MQINYTRRGDGPPLFLVHGFGGHWRSWDTVLEALVAHRSVIAIDLPGFGKSPPLPVPATVESLADAVAQFLREHDLVGVDAVGCSLGARIILELSRRGSFVGRVVSLAPSGFGTLPQRWQFHGAMWAMLRAARWCARFAPSQLERARCQAWLMRRTCARTGALPQGFVLRELQALLSAVSCDAVLRDLLRSSAPRTGAPLRADGTVIGWGRDDRVCAPVQALRAQAGFPGARLHWFDGCGHLPHWEQPQATVRLILDTTPP